MDGRRRFCLAVLLLGGQALGCEETKPTAHDKTLVVVDGEEMTELDLELALDRTLGERSSAATPVTRRKMLEGIARTRAVANQATRRLRPEKLAELEQQMRRHRVRELAERYLEAHAPEIRLDEERIEQYYEAHRDEYSGPATRSYELIAADAGDTTSTGRKALLQSLGDAQKHDNWASWTAHLRALGHPVHFTRGNWPTDALQDEVTAVLTRLGEGEASNPISSGGRFVVVRLLKRQRGPGKNLAEARPEIVKQLSREVLRKALERAGVEAKRQLSVVYK